MFAEIDGKPVGFAIYFLTFSSFLARPGIWLDDLYVDENARGLGAGKALLAHLAKLADERGYGRVEWVTAANNEKGLAFYRRNGARVQEVVRVCCGWTAPRFLNWRVRERVENGTDLRTIVQNYIYEIQRCN